MQFARRHKGCWCSVWSVEYGAWRVMNLSYNCLLALHPIPNSHNTGHCAKDLWCCNASSDFGLYESRRYPLIIQNPFFQARLPNVDFHASGILIVPANYLFSFIKSMVIWPKEHSDWYFLFDCVIVIYQLPRWCFRWLGTMFVEGNVVRRHGFFFFSNFDISVSTMTPRFVPGSINVGVVPAQCQPKLNALL